MNGFREKSAADGHQINGGFFVCEPAAIDYIEGDATVWEQEPLRAMVDDKQLSVYHHKGFWQNMDTLRDKHVLQVLWDSGAAPWKVWNEPLPEAGPEAEPEAEPRAETESEASAPRAASSR